MEKFLEGAVSAIFGILSFLFGGFSGLLITLVAFIVIDYITGFMAAAIKKQLSSEIGAKGIAKKITTLLIVVLGHLIDVYIVKNGDYIMTMAILTYIANEGLSILENAVTLGVKVPDKLRKMLVQLEDDAEKSEDESEGQ